MFYILVEQLGDLGSHSTKKCYKTMVDSGLTVVYSTEIIFLRDLWYMGPLKDRYLHNKKSRDQYVQPLAHWYRWNNFKFLRHTLIHLERRVEKKIMEK